jgi:hypothetical protein
MHRRILGRTRALAFVPYWLALSLEGLSPGLWESLGKPGIFLPCTGDNIYIACPERS